MLSLQRGLTWCNSVGRNPRCNPASFRCCRFNPRPARWPGETSTPAVSTRHPGGFNPHPARWPGEAGGQLNADGQVLVSIHTRHGGRAKHAGRGGQLNADGFQSTPGTVAGRSEQGQPAAQLLRVSIHTRHGGRAKPRRCGLRMVFGGFNPHPARWPGEAMPLSFLTRQKTVSIHTRHGGRAKRQRASAAGHGSAVSIHTRHGGRAKPAAPASACWMSAFQSTPGTVAGRSARLQQQTAADVGVSIHTWHGGRAKPR